MQPKYERRRALSCCVPLSLHMGPSPSTACCKFPFVLGITVQDLQAGLRPLTFVAVPWFSLALALAKASRVSVRKAHHVQWRIAVRKRMGQADRTTGSMDGWFRQERSMFKAVVQVGGRGWRLLEPIFLYLKGVSNKSYLITLTTMAGPTGASKISLESEKRGLWLVLRRHTIQNRQDLGEEREDNWERIGQKHHLWSARGSVGSGMGFTI